MGSRSHDSCCAQVRGIELTNSDYSMKTGYRCELEAVSCKTFAGVLISINVERYACPRARSVVR
jgi:hypothetical protein